MILVKFSGLWTFVPLTYRTESDSCVTVAYTMSSYVSKPAFINWGMEYIDQKMEKDTKIGQHYFF